MSCLESNSIWDFGFVSTITHCWTVKGFHIWFTIHATVRPVALCAGMTQEQATRMQEIKALLEQVDFVRSAGWVIFSQLIVAWAGEKSQRGDAAWWQVCGLHVRNKHPRTMNLNLCLPLQIFVSNDCKGRISPVPAVLLSMKSCGHAKQCFAESAKRRLKWRISDSALCCKNEERRLRDSRDHMLTLHKSFWHAWCHERAQRYCKCNRNHTTSKINHAPFRFSCSTGPADACLRPRKSSSWCVP